MVEVSVGEQHGRRPEPVLEKELGQLVGDTDAGVDNQTLLPRSGCQDVTVGAGDNGRESDGQHAREPNRRGLMTLPPCCCVRPA